ncbi:MAG: hypothetical protein ACKVPX_15685 [Myxococcaceae bacterium]
MSRLGQTGWLSALLREALSSPSAAPEAQEAHARVYVKHVLRESGLHYGTPALPPDTTAAQEGTPDEQLFLSVLRTLVRIALDVAALSGVPRDATDAAMHVLLSAFVGDFASAQAFDAQRRIGKAAAPRALRRLERALEASAPTHTGDPLYGLLLHNGNIYVDANCFARAALDLFVRGRFDAKRARRLRAMGAKQKAVLVEVLTALASVEQLPTPVARKAILSQVKALKLPAALERDLRRRLAAAFSGGGGALHVVDERQSEPLRRFVLEQAVLAAAVQGRHSEKERQFLGHLADAVGFSAEALAQIELEVAAFYATHRGVVDIFKVSPQAQRMGQRLLGNVSEGLQRSFRILMTEVRQTGELSLLITKAARGQTLSPEEKRRMRAQLIDLAKVIPAIALFAAPGGLIILIALAKVLPFDVLPSAFRDNAKSQRKR